MKYKDAVSSLVTSAIHTVTHPLTVFHPILILLPCHQTDENPLALKAIIFIITQSCVIVFVNTTSVVILGKVHSVVPCIVGSHTHPIVLYRPSQINCFAFRKVEKNYKKNKNKLDQLLGMSLSKDKNENGRDSKIFNTFYHKSGMPF